MVTQHLRCFVAAAALLASNVGHAMPADRPGGPPSLKALEANSDFEQFRGEMEKLNVMADQMVRQKKLACLRAFGMATFCECLGAEMPVGASFGMYVGVVTRTKEELGYGRLSSEDRAMADGLI